MIAAMIVARKMLGARKMGGLLGAALALFPSCKGEKERPSPPPAPVEVARAAVEDVPLEVSTIGSVEPLVTVDIKSQVTAQLLSIEFEEGENVEKGKLLFVLDPTNFEHALKNAEAALRRDRAQAAFAKEDAERFAQLARRGAAAKQIAEQKTSEWRALEATVAADEALVRDAKTNLAYTRIKAPVNGRTGALLVHVGDQITANASEPMVTLNQLQPIYVSFSVEGGALPAIRSANQGGNLEVIAKPRGAADEVHDGALTFIDNAVDPASGTILLKGTFPNRDEALWPGQFVDVTLVIGELRAAVVVPSSAVQAGQEGAYVFVIDREQVAQMRHVQTGPRIEGGVVITQGVEGGELVVTDGQLRLQPGSKVTIRERPRGSPEGGPPRGEE